MTVIKKSTLFWLLTLFGSGILIPAQADALIKKHDRIAILGDSITEQKMYSAFMETYMMACIPQYELSVMQFGWSGERAPRFLNRMQSDMLPWGPTVVTICYGMNDGSYRAYDEGIGNTYRDAMTGIIDHLKKNEVRFLIGSPSVVDTTHFRRCSPEVYNENLNTLGGIGKDIAISNGGKFADVHNVMADVMLKAKAKYGKSYHVSGGDGIHPWDNGHLLMAYGFLCEMGFDGQIAMIEMDLNGKTSVSEGHLVKDESAGRVKIESFRYPFCFYGDPKDMRGNLGMLEFIDFNDRLNRFTLKVKGLVSPKAKVIWGGKEKVFSSKALAQGINLAAEFFENPFNMPFKQVSNAVRHKQNFETGLVKLTVTLLKKKGESDPEVEAHLDTTISSVLKIQSFMKTRVLEAFKPVEHEILVQPVP